MIKQHKQKTSAHSHQSMKLVKPNQKYEFFILSIARSTCILRDAICLVSIIFPSSSCFLPFKNGGIFPLTPNSIESSRMSKPLSAMMESPLCNKSSNPIFCVSSLSDIEPGKSFDTNVIAPPGDIPIKALYVLWFLYEERHLLQFGQ